MNKYIYFLVAAIVAIAMPVDTYPRAVSPQDGATAGIERIEVEETRAKSQSGEALLVCSYGDSSCKDMLVEGGILKSEFEKKLTTLSKEQEIIFYCA